MTELRLYTAGTTPEYATAEWYAGRDRARHVDEWLHRPRLERAASLVRYLVRAGNLDTVVDIGAGDGGLLSLLADDPLLAELDLELYGYDLQPSNVAGAAERGVDVRLGDVLTLDRLAPPGRRPVAVCTEVLEHLVDPHGFLRRLVELGADALVASSPWTETTGAAYEFHLWAWDEAGYAELLAGSGWTVTHQERVGMFTVVAATAGGPR